MGVGALIGMERKGCESIIHGHDCDLWVTMVGWVDVPYSGWGDFRRRLAVDISIFYFVNKDIIHYEFAKRNIHLKTSLTCVKNIVAGENLQNYHM